MLQASQAQIIPPGAVIEGVPKAFNPTEYALIIAPLMVDKQVIGLLEILMDPTRRAAQQKSTLRFVSDLCDLAATYLKNRQMRQMMSQQRLWNQLEGFTHQIHGSLDLKETAYAVVNDGKRLVGCDRLSVALKISGRIDGRGGQRPGGRRAAVQPGPRADPALQGGDPLGRGPGLHRQHRRLRPGPPRRAGDVRRRVGLEGRDRHAPAQARDRAGDRRARRTEKVPFGCLVAEQIGDELAPTDMHARTEVVSRHASTALWNAQEHHKIFLKPVLKAMGSPWRMFRGPDPGQDRRGARRACSWSSLIMAFVPCTLTIEGHGSLLPEERRKVYCRRCSAPTSPRCSVDHGDRVKKGDVLVRLESPELEKELQRLMADEQKAQTQCSYLKRQEEQGDHGPVGAGRRWISTRSGPSSPRPRSRPRTRRERIEIIQEQLESMIIRSPQDGIITTWEAKKNLLGRPVEIGTELLQIAATEGEWLLEVEVPDDDMGPILAAKQQARRGHQGRPEEGRRRRSPAYFVTMTDPEHRYNGYVRRIAPSAENVAESRAVQEPPRRQGDRRLPRRGPAGLPEAQPDQGDAARVPRSAPGSTAARPTWPTTCSASRSRSSTSRCCSAGRSCVDATGQWLEWPVAVARDRQRSRTVARARSTS